jgi:D-alanyl-D-alanine carboxypeptidase
MSWIKKALSVVLALGIVAGCGSSAFAVEPQEETGTFVSALPDELTEAPEVNAGAAVLMDVETGAVLYSKNADEQLYPASITKVMTALVTLEHCQLDEVMTYSSEAVNGIEVGSSTAYIPVGAQLTVEESLYAMMLASANEAASALAEYVSGSVSAFAEEMNETAQALGCSGTHFTNANGLPDDDHYTTAHDMALILQEALRYPEFREIAGAKSYVIADRDSLYQEIELWNHFKMIFPTHERYYEYAEGGKTGYTTKANSTLVSYAKKDDVELLCIILNDTGSGSHYQDTRTLYEWGFAQVEQRQPLAGYQIEQALDSEQQKVYSKLGCTYEDSLTVLSAVDAQALEVNFQLAQDQTDGCFGELLVMNGETQVAVIPVTFDPTTPTAQAYLGTETEPEESVVVPEEDSTGSQGVLETADRIPVWAYVLVLAAVILLIVALFRRKNARSRRYGSRRRGSYSGGYRGGRRRR